MENISRKFIDTEAKWVYVLSRSYGFSVGGFPRMFVEFLKI